MSEENPRHLTDEEQIRRSRLEELRAMGINPFGQKFEISRSIKDAIAEFEKAEAEGTLEDLPAITVAGRIMANRSMGKAAFANLKDLDANMQLYFRKNELGEQFDVFDKLYVGDLIGVQGKVFRTQKQEITLRVESFTVLSCALRPLPEKFHGLTDKEQRYRRRYVDLIVNDEVRQTFVRRSKMVSSIRRTLDSMGFMEMETPVLHAIAGGAAARPFKTHHNALDMPFFMRIATELHLKRLLVGGLEKVYELGRIFRNEGVSHKHNPEFTTIEIYQAYADYHDMMEITEILFENAAKEATGSTEVEFGGHTISFARPWKRIGYLESIVEKTGLSLEDLKDVENVRAACKKHKVDVDLKLPIGKLYDELFGELVEPTLIQPTFVIDYPIENSPLARRIEDRPHLTYRFEGMVAGMEVANAFTELNDPIDQLERFEQQMKDRAQGDDEAHEMDQDFVECLEYGMPPAGGLGIGIDRMAMLLSGNDSIREVILFPHMRNR